MSILLTEQEIKDTINAWLSDDDDENDDMTAGFLVAKSQARKIFEELKKPCPHHDEKKEQRNYDFKRECPLCIAEMESEL